MADQGRLTIKSAIDSLIYDEDTKQFVATYSRLSNDPLLSTEPKYHESYDIVINASGLAKNLWSEYELYKNLNLNGAVAFNKVGCLAVCAENFRLKSGCDRFYACGHPAYGDVSIVNHVIKVVETCQAIAADILMRSA